MHQLETVRTDAHIAQEIKLMPTMLLNWCGNMALNLKFLILGRMLAGYVSAQNAAEKVVLDFTQLAVVPVNASSAAVTQ